MIQQINRLLEIVKFYTEYFPDDKLPESYTILIALKIYNAIQLLHYVDCDISLQSDGEIILEWHSRDWQSQQAIDRSIICIGICTICYTWWEKLLFKPKLPKVEICAVATGKLDYIYEHLSVENCIDIVQDWFKECRDFWINPEEQKDRVCMI